MLAQRSEVGECWIGARFCREIGKSEGLELVEEVLRREAVQATQGETWKEENGLEVSARHALLPHFCGCLCRGCSHSTRQSSWS